MYVLLRTCSTDKPVIVATDHDIRSKEGVDEMIGHDYILKITLTKAWVLVVHSVSHAVRPACEMASVLKPDIQGGRQCWFLEGQAA